MNISRMISGRNTLIIGYALLFGAFALLVSLVSCGPSRAEIEADAQRSKEAAVLQQQMMNTAYHQLVDSVRRVVLDSLKIKKVETTQWYNSKDIHVSTGKVHGFFPKEEATQEDADKEKHFYVIMEDSEGKLTINESSYKVWAILNRGDLVR